MPKTVLITGCSSGSGRATARLFADRGWNVIATMRNTADGAELALRHNVVVSRLDVEDPSTINAAIAAGIERFAGIDTLVNNAGFGAFGLFETSTPELIMRQFQVNVFGVMDTIRAVLPHFRQRGAGTIVNVSSGAGVFTLPLISLYCASKFALEGFSEALSYELAALNITVKIVEPGGVSGTNFGRRSGQEASAAPEIPEYAQFLLHAGRVFEALHNAEMSTAEDVANAIFIAATDGREQLRYVQGKDIEPLVTARRQLGEDGYLSLLRRKFGLGKL